MVQSIANWTSYLQSETARTKLSASREQYEQPTTRVLMALMSTSTIPLTEIVSATQLSASTALEAVEKLRDLEQIEVFEQGEGGGARFLRLTPMGYAAVSDLKASEASIA